MASNGSVAGTGLTQEQIAAVRAPLEQAALLPAKVYSDPQIFRLERERIFARSWILVCHASQITEPGAYVARHLHGEAVLAIRDRDGRIRVMSNVCRHRNTVLLQGAGQCKGRIVCPYHGWTYGLDGKLLAAPFMEQAQGFARRETQLPQLRHELWHGFVFVNFDPQARPLAEQVAGLEPHMGQYRFEDWEAFEMRRRTMPWNWKISLENFSEAAEQGFPAKLAQYRDSSGPYSLFLLPQENGELLRTFKPPTPGLEDLLLRSVSVFNMYPYFHGLVDPGTALILDFNIKNESEHELVWTVLMPRGNSTRAELEPDVEKFHRFIDPILAEDIGVCTGVGQGVQSRLTAQGRLSHMEKAIHQFHNWWLDHMLADAGISPNTH